nr:Hpt domain-containing protein [Methylomarinum sp. Ch1-1]MDP4521149.1 Hpt domain-containing protein [Methylomarinum sp. Ch1-1]
MSIDMAQFHQVFFEESFEGLDAMETGLLNLDEGDIDAINTIFRAAHSIKGGSGTFGFTSVSDFTHVMETLLDEMRDGSRPVTQSAVDVLLGSVDCLREMLTAIRDQQNLDTESVAAHQQALQREFESGGSVSPRSDDTGVEGNAVAEQASEVEGWRIAFSPHTDLLRTGNDPVRMFRELAELGDIEATVDFQGVPDIHDLDPEECHLSWQLSVNGDIPRAEIDEIFAWVEDECDLAIQASLGGVTEHNEAPQATQNETGDRFSAPRQVQAPVKTGTNDSTKPADSSPAKPKDAKRSQQIHSERLQFDTRRYRKNRYPNQHGRRIGHYSIDAQPDRRTF